VAKTGKLSYEGQSQRPQLSAISLGYSHQDLVNCLCSLTPSQFIESKGYLTPRANKTVIFDVYLANCINSQGQRDTIYLKLRLSSSWLIIGSFHLPRLG
jgi:hypothetical protein